jgi:hypothetical protein
MTGGQLRPKRGHYPVEEMEMKAETPSTRGSKTRESEKVSGEILRRPATCLISSDLDDVGRPIAGELLADVGLVLSRGRAHAASLVTRAEVVGAGEGDGLGRVTADEEDGDGQIGGILAILVSSPVGHAFDTRVIRDLFVVARHGAALKLPPAGSVVDVGERRAVELQS